MDGNVHTARAPFFFLPELGGMFVLACWAVVGSREGGDRYGEKADGALLGKDSMKSNGITAETPYRT